MSQEMTETVRVRYAPSPTGALHIGGARTALFNWLFARHNGGAFVLRIEDTDLQRSREESAIEISEVLQWLGMDWDEGPGKDGPYGPYYQSLRLEIYHEHAHRLLERDLAYPCYCTPEELAERREKARSENRPPRYDGRCRDLDPTERRRLERQGRRFALRLKVPHEGATVVRDLIRGDVVFENSVFDDLVVMKSDGMPTYNFACVVDDALMRITHVIRGEEHLSNTPKQILLYEALGFPLPEFAHVPMILAPDRTKLSKRHGATSVEEFRDQGYLPEAVINYIALLGWSPPDGDEIMSMSELVSKFSLEKVVKTAAIYDVGKLAWFNGHYLRGADLDRLVQQVLPFLRRKGYPVEVNNIGPYLRRAIGLVRDRVRTLSELADAVSYFVDDGFQYDPKGAEKHFGSRDVARILACAKSALAPLEDFTPEEIERTYRELASRLGISSGQLFHPTRLAVTGRTVGPGLFDIMALIGRDAILRRLDRAISEIEKKAD